MKTEIECEIRAKEALESYVNSCQCQSEGDIQSAINKMIAMCLHASAAVAEGKKGVIQ